MDEWSQEEKLALNALAKGRPVVANCHLGWGLSFQGRDDGRLSITVNKSPEWVKYPLVREWMEEVAVEWLKQAAPHRLSYGSDY